MKKKFIKITIVSVLLVLVFATIVNALSFTVTMTPSSTTVAESTEFTVIIKVSNLDVGTNGINAMSGYLRYDKDVFETITDSSIDGLNTWKRDYSADSGRITLTKTTFVKGEEQVFQLTLKTKAGTAGKKGKIEFTNIVASNSESEISATDVSTEITIGNVSGNVANTTGNTGNAIIITPNPGNNTAENAPAGNNSVVPAPVNNTIKPPVTNSTPDEVPYTGVEDSIMYIIAGIVCLGIVFYIKFERINKEMK